MGLFDTAEARLVDLESRVAALEAGTATPPVDPPVDSPPIVLATGQTVERTRIWPAAYTESAIGVRGLGVSDVTLRGVDIGNCGYGLKVGSGALTERLTVEDFTARDCAQPVLLANLHEAAFSRVTLEAPRYPTNQWHGMYIERDVQDVTFSDLHISGGSGYCLQLYYGSSTVSANLVFEDVTLDATDGRYPLIISNGFRNITFRRCKIIMPSGSDGVCVRLYSPTAVLFEDFEASGGVALVGSVSGGTPQATFRNGNYRGPALVQGTLPNVVMDNVVRS